MPIARTPYIPSLFGPCQTRCLLFSTPGADVLHLALLSMQTSPGRVMLNLRYLERHFRTPPGSKHIQLLPPIEHPKHLPLPLKHSNVSQSQLTNHNPKHQKRQPKPTRCANSSPATTAAGRTSGSAISSGTPILYPPTVKTWTSASIPVVRIADVYTTISRGILPVGRTDGGLRSLDG